MSRHRRVIWREGMLLSPQDLQQRDRHVESVLDNRLRTLQPFGSGFTHLVVDADGLRIGQIGILEARGVLPDGTPFAVPDHDPVPAPRAIGDHFSSGEDALRVHFGIPKARAGKAQVGEAAPPGSPGPRYTSESIQIGDDNDAASLRTVTVASQNLSVLFPPPGDALEEHDALPFAELKRLGEGAFTLRDDYVPPCLAVGASRYLMSRLKSELDALQETSRELSKLRNVRADVADFSVGDLNSFGRLLRVNACIPLLKHIVERPHIHPERVYRLLASLVGEMCSFVPSPTPMDLPSYNHEALGSTFRDLHAIFLRVIPPPGEHRCVRIDLQKLEDSIHVGNIEDPRLLEPGSSMFVGASADVEKDRLLRDFPVKAKIASRGDINRIIQFGLEGVPVSFVQDPPGACPRRPNFFYFKLDPAGAAWNGIRGAKNLAIFAPQDMPGLSLDLLAMRG